MGLISWMFGKAAEPEKWPRDDGRDEKVRSGPAGVKLPYFLPYFDDQQTMGETPAMRTAYRRMLADPATKAAVLGKIFGVAALELNINPVDNKNERQVEQAKFMHWNLTRRLKEGVPGMVWDILSGGLIDGFSVCEKIRGHQDWGTYKGKSILRQLKAKDVNQDLVLEVDDYRNITGIRALRYNAGEVFDPKDFVIFTHLGLFDNPTGMSDLRAAYARYWMLDTVIKLRAMGAEKRALPLIVGEYPDVTKQPALEAALAKVKSQNWLAVPAGVQANVLDVAGSASAYFKEFCDDLKEDIVLSIEGATLQAMAGGVGRERGDTKTHKDTADLRKWFLSACVLHLLNDLESGLIREQIDLNYRDVDEYPYATFGGVDDGELGESMQIDKGLQEMGFKHKIEDIAERYGRHAAQDGEEVLQPPAAAAGMPVPGKDNPNDMVDLGDNFSEVFWERFDETFERLHPRARGKFARKALKGLVGTVTPGMKALMQHGARALAAGGAIKQQISEVVGSRWNKMPKPVRLAVAGFIKVAYASYVAGNKAVHAAALAKGLSEAEASRVSKATSTADLVFGGGRAAAIAAIVGVPAHLAPAAAFVPWGSVAYLTYAGSAATLKAARKAVKAVLQAAGRDAFSETADLQDLVARYAFYANAGQANLFEACLYAAMDRASSLGEAVAIADQAVAADKPPKARIEGFADQPELKVVEADADRVERLLERCKLHGVAVLTNLAAKAVERLANDPVAAMRAKRLFDHDEQADLTEAFATVSGTAELLGRSRVLIRMENAEEESAVRKHSEEPTDFERFDDSAGTGIPPMAPAKAVEYFKTLVPSLGVDPKRWGAQQLRSAFTLAGVTDLKLLGAVKDLIRARLEGGQDFSKAPGEIEDLLRSAGVSPKHAGYARMVFRTNMMDAYNAGWSKELEDPKVRKFFPAWRYHNPADDNSRETHAARSGNLYDAAKPFFEVRGTGIEDAANCRCTGNLVDKWELKALLAEGKVVIK